MKILCNIIFYIFVLTICYEANSRDIFESDFIDIEVETSNAKEAKENSINIVKNISFNKIIDKILNEQFKKKFNELIDRNVVTDKFVKNIIIENEIITDKKYIAKIKINFDREKIVKLLRNSMINYTDLTSDPFLVISTYNINFNNIGLDKINSYNFILKNKLKNKDELVDYSFPNLDSNDRYILPYTKIINEDKKAFNQILNKYNLHQLIIINIFKSNIQNKIDINLKIYDKDGLHNLDNISFNNIVYKTSDELFNYLFDEVLFYMSEWWKNKYQINNNEFHIIECKILSNNFNDLIKIKSNINNLSQVKYVNTKRIQLSNDIIEFFYYGKLNVLIKSLSLSNNFNTENNECIITSN